MTQADGVPSEDRFEVSRRAMLAGVVVAGAGLVVADARSAAAAAIPAANGYVYPTNPFIVNNHSSTWYGASRPNGRRHMGVDCQGSRGQAIYAIAGGDVIGGDWSSSSSDPHGYGNNILIDHRNGVVSRYAHFEGAPLLGLGAAVVKGQQIGRMGNSQFGPTSGLGVHLHLEIQVNNGFVNPQTFLIGNSTSAPEAGVDSDPGYDNSAIHRRNNGMATLYYKTEGGTVFALAGDGVGDAAWLETTQQSFANQLAAQHGNAALLSLGTWNAWKAAYRSAQPTR